MKIGEKVGCNYFEIGVYCVGLTTSSLAGKRLEGSRLNCATLVEPDGAKL